MTQMNSLQANRPLRTWLASFVACIALIGAPLTAAQAPAASGSAAEVPSPEVLETLVGRIALYPDDLVALILPASTNPLQLVQADRFLNKRKSDPKLPIDDNWDDAVKSLLNYPEVVKQMSDDLDWTADLGEAVVANQGAVLDAVQAFRRKAQAAQNLKSDDKQTVVVEKEVIKIVPADPQVVYVPQYNPSSVVVVSSTPVYGYYPAPYPSYYYPYPPGAALATGLIWGAAIGAAWNGGHYGANWGGGNNNITINRGNNNINTGDINRGNSGNRPSQQSGGGTAWKSDKKPGQVSSGAGRGSASAQRVGDAGRGGAAGARTSAQPGGGTGQAGRASSLGAASATPRGAGSGGGGGQDAFGGYGSGNGARADSSRGASSRSSMSGSGGARSSASSAGARGGGGGGGARGGGGGRGGGGRR